MISKGRIILLALIVSLVACEGGGGQSGGAGSSVDGNVVRHRNEASIASGEKIYAAQCARCHGNRAQGDSNWRRKDPDGFYPPPPLDGSGHAWHHSRQMLRQMIKYGSPPTESGAPTGRMPAWHERLSDRQIDAIIDWFQSLWPDQVYAIWYHQQQRVPVH